MASLLSLSSLATGSTPPISSVPLAFALHSTHRSNAFFTNSRGDEQLCVPASRNLHYCRTLRPSGDTFTRRKHHSLFLSSQHSNGETISEMPLSHLLQLLQQYNIRYGPNSTREELEDLLSRAMMREEEKRAETTARSGARSEDGRKKVQKAETVDGLKNDWVMDAVVVEPEEQQQYNSANNRSSAQKSRRRREKMRDRRRYSTVGNDARDQTRPRANRRSEYTRIDESYQDERQTPRNRQYTDHESIIDADFDLPNPSHYNNNKPNEPYYENGLQIFLMGFMEAGKTAAELAMDAARSNLPFADEGELWFDEENGRDFLDANVLDYRQIRYDEDGRRPGPRNRRRHPMRREWEGGYEEDRRWDVEGSDLDYQRSASVVSASGKIEPLQGIRPDPTESRSMQRRRRAPSRSRNHVDKVGNPKPVYGLYNDEDLAPLHDNEETSDHIRKSHHHKQQWKDRLRTKFDAALGLESPLEQHEYYDSWKRNMERMEDGHKQRLRDKMNDERSTLASTLVSTPSEPGPVRIPRNRRARVRALKDSSLKDAISPPTAQRTKSTSSKVTRKKKKDSKMCLEEEPFWKDRGSFASVLFDNRPASIRRSMKKKRNTLEQLLLSPLGRERTLTSLLLYITRSSLSVFGNLCRWAGVRGTIPQPIVVVTVCAVLLSSYRQQRVLALGLTLLAIRMLGEFIHGSVHGNEFWDDEYDEENHEWVTEDDVDDVVTKGSRQRTRE